MKKLLAMMVALTMLFALACPVSASPEQVPFSTMVVDSADILNDVEELELAEKAWNLTMDYDCAVYIVTMDSIEDMNSWEFNEAIHREYRMGYGMEQSCIILLLSMEYRDYDIMAHGYGNYVFTDYGKEIMSERFLDEFGSNEWYDGFEEYLDCCEEYLKLAAQGKPFDVGDNRSPVLGVAIATGVSSLIALIVCTVFKAQMKTARRQEYAADYVVGSGLNLSKRVDLYTHTSRKQRYIQPQSSSGGRGGTSVNRSGSSHRSGKF